MNYFKRLAILTLTVMLPCFSHAEEQVVSTTVMPFFTALGAGDVTQVKNYVAGTLADNITTRLEQDPAYPEFLKQHYDGVQFEVTNVTYNGEEILVDAGITFPGVGTSNYKLILRKDMNNDWKIFDQIEIIQ